MSLTTSDKQYIHTEIQTAFGVLDTKSDKISARLDAKIDNLGNRLDAKIDTLADRLDTKIDTLTDRLDAKIDTQGARLENLIHEEVNRIEVLIEDRDDILEKILELLTDQTDNNAKVKQHDQRLDRLENNENLMMATLSVHSKEIKKLGGNLA